ncbi:hypothetical protein AB6E88_14340 [Providencia hangzhouensis]
MKEHNSMIGNIINSGEGNDIIISNGGVNVFYGGNGDDYVYGGENSDLIIMTWVMTNLMDKEG